MSQLLASPSRYSRILEQLFPHLRAVVWDVQGSVRVGSKSRYDARGGPLKITVTRTGALSIGSGCFINFGLDLYCTNHVEIGDYTLIGPRVFIADSNAHHTNPKKPPRVGPVRIGRNAWICHSAAILPGVAIGDHAVVAAGAIVTRDVPSCSIVAGSPARLLSTFKVDSDNWIRNEHAG